MTPFLARGLPEYWRRNSPTWCLIMTAPDDNSKWITMKIINRQAMKGDSCGGNNVCRDIALSTIAKSCVRNTCFMWHHCSLSRWRLQDRGTKCHMRCRSPKLSTNLGSKRKWCKTKNSNSVELPMYSRDIEAGREVMKARNLDPVSTTTSVWQPKLQSGKNVPKE